MKIGDVVTLRENVDANYEDGLTPGMVGTVILDHEVGECVDGRLHRSWFVNIEGYGIIHACPINELDATGINVLNDLNWKTALAQKHAWRILAARNMIEQSEKALVWLAEMENPGVPA